MLKDILHHFLATHRRPYSLDQAADLTGIPRRSLSRLHAQALERGETREAEPGIYISVLAHRGHVSVNPSGRASGVWRLDAHTAGLILDELEREPSLSSRRIGRRLGLSHTIICQYLTALMSIHAIGFSAGYTVLSRDLSRLGLDIERGILAKARANRKKEN